MHREKTQQTTDEDANETWVPRKRTTEDGKLKKPQVKLAPLFIKKGFLGKNRAGDVAASHQQAEKIHWKLAG